MVGYIIKDNVISRAVAEMEIFKACQHKEVRNAFLLVLHGSLPNMLVGMKAVVVQLS